MDSTHLLEALHRARRRIGLATTGQQVPPARIPDAVPSDGAGPPDAVALRDGATRRRTEDALRESDEKFHQLADNISDAFWIRSPDMRELYYVSPAFERIWGRPVETLYSDPGLWQEFILAEDRERVLAAFAKLPSESASLDLEYRIVRPDGGIRWIRVRSFQVHDAEGRLIRQTGIVTDITEAKRVRAALEASAEEFRTLAEAMPQIVWITGPDGDNSYCNQQWMDYTGLDRAQGLGDGWLRSFHADDRERVSQAWRSTEPSTLGNGTEGRLRRADGTYRWWLIRSVPVRDAGGGIIKWIGTCTDIHDLKVAELEISRVNRALQVLSACSEAVMRAEHERALLGEICRIAVDDGGYRMAWVGYALDDVLGTIEPVAHAGVEDGYLADVHAAWTVDDPQAQGPAGQALRGGRAVVCEDLLGDPRYARWIPAARLRGYRGVIVLPLRDGDRTFGVLALYADVIAETSTQELALLQEMADNLAFGIVHLRARMDQQRLQAAVIKVASGVSAATGTQFYEQLARNMAEALGARAGFVAELLPDDPGGARTIAAIVDGELTENFEYQLAGTPCASLLTTRTCVMAERVAEQFPHSPRLAALGAQAYAGQRLDSSDGRPLGLIFVVFQDPPRHIDLITSTLQIFAARAAAEIERQRTDAQVREQAALLDIAHEAILVKDMQGRIIFWNKGAERIYGWTAAEALGRDAVELLHDDAADFRAAHAALLDRNDWEGELTRRARDGRSLVVQVRWTLVRDAQGAPKAIFAINSDVTEAKRLEAQFLRAQRTESIGTLASGIAHDLNNVLAPILMSVEMLKDMTVTEDDRDVLAMLQGSAQRGAELVRQVLTFARGVEGQRIVVNPLHVMRDLLRVMRDTFPKSVSLRFTAAPDLWSVTGDPTQLYQVFLNLCVNARDAMPNGGRLTIRMENAELDEGCGVLDPGAPRGAYVKVRIEDTGAGIPAQLRDRIFEPFFTTKGVGAGTGLGLSTTLAIVKSHGGCVQLSSEVGSGTTFTVYLAADAARAAAEGIEADETRLPRGNGELILVVDDEAAIRGIARRALERFGYRVVLADNGAEAAVLYGRRHAEIAAVLTDMAMPVMDGAATIRAIRAVNPAARIIASSGLAQGVEVGAETGTTHFISKPYTTERLLKTLHALLDGAPPVTH